MQEVSRQTSLIDLAAFDAEGRPVLLAEVKAMTNAMPSALDWVKALAKDFQSTGLPIPYWMLIDLNQILVFSGEKEEEITLQFESATDDILNAYDSTFSQKRIFEGYLLTLVNAWLHDLARQWKYSCPPGFQQLTEVGLVERLRGGVTHREVSFAHRDFVSRNQLLDESLLGSQSIY